MDVTTAHRALAAQKIREARGLARRHWGSPGGYQCALGIIATECLGMMIDYASPWGIVRLGRYLGIDHDRVLLILERNDKGWSREKLADWIEAGCK
jgi:hypothetical protein